MIERVARPARSRRRRSANSGCAARAARRRSAPSLPLALVLGRCELHLDQLGAEVAADDRRSLPLLEHRLVDVELVRVDGALHHRLAQAVARGDEDDVVEAATRCRCVNITPAAPRSERTMRCTPADSATSACAIALVHAVADGAVVVERGEDLASSCASTSSMPTTLRKVSCWPANDASGRSSAVADERTANDASALPAARLLERAADRLLERRRERLRLDPAADLGAGRGQRAHVVGVERGQALARCARPGRRASRKSRNACAVVAKPPGTRTPGAGQLADHLAEARRSCRRPPRRRSSSGFRTVRPGRSPGGRG